MHSLLLTLSMAFAGDPCAQQGDPALPIALDLSFNEVEDLYRGDLEGFLREHLAGIRERE